MGTVKVLLLRKIPTIQSQSSKENVLATSRNEWENEWEIVYEN